MRPPRLRQRRGPPCDGPLGRDAQGPFADAAHDARKVLEEITIADVLERELREAGPAALVTAGRCPIVGCVINLRVKRGCKPEGDLRHIEVSWVEGRPFWELLYAPVPPDADV